jgi:hypothetical protein
MKLFVPLPDWGLYRGDPRRIAAKKAEVHRTRGSFPLDHILRLCGYTVRDGGGSRAVPAEPMEVSYEEASSVSEEAIQKIVERVARDSLDKEDK